MAVAEIVGLKSVFDDPPHYQLFKHHAEVVEDTFRLATLLVAMVGFTEYITANEKIICSPKEMFVNLYASDGNVGSGNQLWSQTLQSSAGNVGSGNQPWLKISNELCEDELLSTAER